MMPIFKGEYDNLNPPNPNSKSLSKTKNHQSTVIWKHIEQTVESNKHLYKNKQILQKKNCRFLGQRRNFSPQNMQKLQQFIDYNNSKRNSKLPSKKLIPQLTNSDSQQEKYSQKERQKQIIKQNTLQKILNNSRQSDLLQLSSSIMFSQIKQRQDLYKQEIFMLKNNLQKQKDKTLQCYRIIEQLKQEIKNLKNQKSNQFTNKNQKKTSEKVKNRRKSQQTTMKDKEHEIQKLEILNNQYQGAYDKQQYQINILKRQFDQQKKEVNVLKKQNQTIQKRMIRMQKMLEQLLNEKRSKK